MCDLSSITDGIDVEKEMIHKSIQDPDFIIDGVHFGRGYLYVDKDNSVKLNHISEAVTCWKIVEDKLTLLNEGGTVSNFYDTGTYLVRWTYVTESVDLSSDKVLQRSRMNTMYFYWSGQNAAKKYSPLPEELQEDNPPVERVVQWAEPPIFLRLFFGSFIVNRGKKDSADTEARLYILRGELEDELHLYEVKCSMESLRSRTCFVLVEPLNITIWYGNKSSETCRSAIKTIANKVFGSNIEETEEGTENGSFLEKLQGSTDDYRFCKHKPLELNILMPRLFYFSNVTGNFLPVEVEVSHKSSLITPLPFLQSHLYSVTPPAVFLLDDGENETLWIWQRHATNPDDEFASQCKIVDRIATVYLHLRSIKDKKVIHAGLEPLSFTNLFPSWTKKSDVTEAHQKMGFPNP